MLENSNKGPVLVNFWADWAVPCHRLSPLLARLAREYAGKFLLVTLNTDEQAPIARAYRVTSLPLVKIFCAGKVVESVHGYQPESEVRRIVDQHIASKSDERIAAAIHLYRRGDIEAGLSLLARAALDDPDNLCIHAVLGKLLMAQHRYDEAETLLRGLPPETRQREEISHLLAHIGFIQVARKAPAREALAARLGSDPGELEARYELAALAVVNNDYEAALENLLELALRNRRFGEDTGRKGMLAVFHLLGNQALVARYRARMSKLMH